MALDKKHFQYDPHSFEAQSPLAQSHKPMCTILSLIVGVES